MALYSSTCRWRLRLACSRCWTLDIACLVNYCSRSFFFSVEPIDKLSDLTISGYLAVNWTMKDEMNKAAFYDLAF
jgi:hypothetical protein